jgi:hypothetical protein
MGKALLKTYQLMDPKLEGQYSAKGAYKTMIS